MRSLIYKGQVKTNGFVHTPAQRFHSLAAVALPLNSGQV